jgi:hypothetical protein
MNFGLGGIMLEFSTGNVEQQPIIKVNASELRVGVDQSEGKVRGETVAIRVLHFTSPLTMQTTITLSSALMASHP